LGFPRKFIGIEIEKIEDGSIFLHQTKLLNEFLEQNNFDSTETYCTSMPPISSHVMTENEKIIMYPYYKIIGTSLYLANTTCPDISFAVSYLAQFQVNPLPIHHKLISHLLSYLNTHKNMGLHYERFPTVNTKIELFADADYATDKTRHSTTGYLIRYKGSIIHWASRLQNCIAQRTSESELCAMNIGAHNALFITRLVEELLD